jgi:hypothetical protein
MLAPHRPPHYPLDPITTINTPRRREHHALHPSAPRLCVDDRHGVQPAVRVRNAAPPQQAVLPRARLQGRLETHILQPPALVAAPIPHQRLEADGGVHQGLHPPVGVAHQLGAPHRERDRSIPCAPARRTSARERRRVGQTRRLSRENDGHRGQTGTKSQEHVAFSAIPTILRHHYPGMVLTAPGVAPLQSGLRGRWSDAIQGHRVGSVKKMLEACVAAIKVPFQGALPVAPTSSLCFCFWVIRASRSRAPVAAGCVGHGSQLVENLCSHNL